ncbi:hypothetical protein [Metabacillus fastidiosus]|uniref:hypothetical protein n=1 Tax=Metabacillus fastidiosus TaxID=1458 RepID=UPI002DBC8231|nr:hypothetical protein [Metabacillus fastidiosus]MEC2076243.1 hypothetical protein [Metabacillus fastidiosus]
MNIGLGFILIPIGVIFIVLSIFSFQKNEKTKGYGMLIAGTVILSICILLLLGMYDPYRNYI